jgi:hypothetical protein
MKKLLPIIFMVTFLYGCKVPCTSPTSVAYNVESWAITYYECTNGDALRVDWNTAFNSVGLCSTAPTDLEKVDPDSLKRLGGPISVLLCPIVVPELVDMSFKPIIKPEYGCNPALVGKYAEEAVEYLCEMIPFAPESK